MDRLRVRKSGVREWYLDLKLLGEFYDGRKYHHTASSTLLYGLCEGLRVIDEEGWQTRFDRHVRNHRALVGGLEKLVMTMHVAEGKRIPTLNTPRLPGSLDDAKVRKHLLDRHRIEVAGGFGPLAGKILRIGLMGPLSTERCVALFLSALQEALAA